MLQNNKLFKVLDEYIYFDNALESQEYAKNNPGKTVIRNSEVVDEEIIQYKMRKKLEITPQDILDYLNKHVIAQDEAKKEVALALYYHVLNTKYEDRDELSSNDPVMLIGPTGSGKTFIIQEACKFVDIPFVHVDASSMVPEGIKGYSISNVTFDILARADYDLERAQKGIVFFDEIDKLFLNDDASEYGPTVATQLLRFIEGTLVETVVKEKDSSGISIDVDTSNMQFFIGGAFQDLLERKYKQKNTMGFANIDEVIEDKKITIEDLYNSSVPKEFVGRMGSIINLKKLTLDDYIQVLTHSKSSPLSQYIRKIEFHGSKVNIDSETIYEIAKNASQSDLGVRGMKQILKKLFQNALFNVANGEIVTYEIAYKENESRQDMSV